MAERVNYAYFGKDTSLVISDRWGGCDIWKYLIVGAEYTIIATKRKEKYQKILEFACDGAILIDEVDRIMIFDSNCCELQVMIKSIIKYEGEVLSDEYEDGLNYFYLRENRLSPIFIELLISIAKISWLGWRVFYADHNDFLTQGVIEKNIEKIKSINYHLADQESFPKINPGDILETMKEYFRPVENSSELEIQAFKNLELYERSQS